MSTAPKKFCFVLMPFADHFDDIYKLGIKQSCLDAGAYCERVDEQIYQESMLERIYNQISKADIIIADVTERNPNVFYEVGYAHALGKTTILLTKDADDIPFDLRHYPHIIYNSKIINLKEELTKRIKWYLDNMNEIEVKQKIDIDLYYGKESLSNPNVRCVIDKNEFSNLSITLHNKTFKTLRPGEYSIGIITSQDFPRARYSRTTELPDGKLFHLLTHVDDTLYPNIYSSFLIALERKILGYSDDGYNIPILSNLGEKEIIIRLFTSNGTRDFFLTIVLD